MACVVGVLKNCENKICAVSLAEVGNSVCNCACIVVSVKEVNCKTFFGNIIFLLPIGFTLAVKMTVPRNVESGAVDGFIFNKGGEQSEVVV